MIVSIIRSVEIWYNNMQWFEVSECYKLPELSVRPATFGLEQDIFMHCFNQMVRSFNFLIAAGYPKHWIKSVNHQLHVYRFIQAVLNTLQCLWNCFPLSYK